MSLPFFPMVPAQLPQWVVIWSTVAGALAGTVTFGRFARRRYVAVKRWGDRIGQAVPVIFEIAEEFRNNSGSSLRDKIETIEKLSQSAAANADAAKASAAVLQKHMQRQTQILEELQAAGITRKRK